jgi:hypothetical protein
MIALQIEGTLVRRAEARGAKGAGASALVRAEAGDGAGVLLQIDASGRQAANLLKLNPGARVSMRASLVGTGLPFIHLRASPTAPTPKVSPQRNRAATTFDHLR